MIRILIPGILLSLLACGPNGKQKSPSPPTSRSYDWGTFSWSLENTTMYARLTRVVKGGRRSLRIQFLFETEKRVSCFEQWTDESKPTVVDHLDDKWTPIELKSDEVRCRFIKYTTPTSISPEDIQDILHARGPLSVENGFEVLDSQFARHPRLDLPTNMGTRSILFVNAKRNGVKGVIAALYDLQKHEFVGIAIKPNWLSDSESDESFRTISGDSYLLRLIQRDETDLKFKARRLELRRLYNYPLYRQEDENARRGVYTIDAVRDQLLAKALDQLKQDPEEKK